MRELKYVLVALTTIALAMLISVMYTGHQNRRAYYACLQLSEKLAEQQKQTDGSVRVVSLPYCRI